MSDAAAESLDDTVAPVISASVDGESAPAGAYRSPAHLVLNVTDDSAGVAFVEYRTQRGEWTAYTEPMRLRPGVWDVEVRAVDVNGNAVAQQLDRIRVIGAAVGLPEAAAPTAQPESVVQE